MVTVVTGLVCSTAPYVESLIHESGITCCCRGSISHMRLQKKLTIIYSEAPFRHFDFCFFLTSF
jgi:hypothetical protein